MKSRPKRTVVQIYDDLCLQGFNGSYSAVSRYATKFNKMLEVVNPAACIPLSFKPGEAYQFDWSSEEVITNDEIIRLC